MNTINIMEVCGTHTMAIARYGLKKLFPSNVNMLSGPGCPVCVTPIENIDQAICIGKQKDTILTTFGDMFNVPGSYSSLSKEHAKGMDVRIVYSITDAVEIAKDNQNKEVVFLGVGFETTSPTIASQILNIKKPPLLRTAKQRCGDVKNIKNFSVLPMFKTIPAALKTILEMENLKVDAFILPGHVSTIIGSEPYEFISKNYNKPGVITGFEPKDILDSIHIILKQIKNNEPKIQIQYSRSVSACGNKFAQEVMSDVFEPCDSNWRAIGVIKNSGLTFNSNYQEFDASKRFTIKTTSTKEPRGCLCGSILLGTKKPKQCRHFAKKCSPENPIGPCMVSSEGACAAVYKYGN